MVNRIYLLVLCLLLVTSSLIGQNSSVWNGIQQSEVRLTGERRIIPQSYFLAELDLLKFKQHLSQSPLETEVSLNENKFQLRLPDANGQLQRFSVAESPIMEAELAEKFPEIKTYIGKGIDDKAAIVRFDITPQGFHAMILSPENGAFYIDPFCVGNTAHYIVYNKKDFIPFNKTMECHFRGGEIDLSNYTQPEGAFGDCQMREYRLALACTGEYASFHGGTIPLVQAAMVTSLNRVNTVYERDLSIRLILIGNNDQLIYLDNITDPYTNNSGFLMLGQNQSNIDAVIGFTNYDIGHVFSTGGGGIASLNSPCTIQKAQGVTGLGSPVGDPFDIDFVAHEMGHQFGGTHSYNNSCGGNRTASTAYEPGSGSTIMAYAGICPPNVQNNSDPHFHAVNLAQIAANVVTGASSVCPNLVSLTNNAPNANAGNNYIVPVSTPFVLTALGSDPDAGDVLTYCWEQYDNELSVQPPLETSTDGPNFRSIDPSTSSSRYFPALSSLANGVSPTWEVIPSVSRIMNFVVTVRDNAPGGGCTDEDYMVINFNDNAGPFEVTNPSTTGIVWEGLTNATVLWNVANTDAAPINCANVDILLSLDGGLTFPITLATSVPNDGSHEILVPDAETTEARVMVICSDNIFFNISTVNFEILDAISNYNLLISADSVLVCAPDSLVLNVDVDSILGFTEPVDITLDNLPAGVVPNFTSTTINAGNSLTIILTEIENATVGTYPITVNANGSTGMQSEVFYLTIAEGAPDAVVLNTPADGSVDVEITEPLTWTPRAQEVYSIQIAADPLMQNVIESANNIGAASYVPTSLDFGATYYWQVTATTSCGVGEPSAVYQFSTQSCFIYSSDDLPLNIPTSGLAVASIPVSENGVIKDVNILDLRVLHSRVPDVIVTLQSPNVTNVVLVENVCSTQSIANMLIAFDDEASNPYSAINCTSPIGQENTYQPLQPLSGFDGANGMGNWRLIVNDVNPLAGGFVVRFEMEICYQPVCNLQASIPSVIDCESSCSASVTAYPAFGLAPFSYQWSSDAGSQTTATANDLCVGTYTVTITDDNGCEATSTVVVAEAAPLQLIINSTDQSCGQSDGSAEVIVTSGQGPFTYLWSTTPAQIDAKAVDLSAGTYAVTVTDGNGCEAIETVNVNLSGGQSSGDAVLNLFETFPNPSNGQFNLAVELSDCSESIVTIYSASGQLVDGFRVEAGMNLRSVDISDFPQGIYFVRIQYGKKYASKRIVIF